MSDFLDNPIRKTWMETAAQYDSLAIMTGTQKVIYEAMKNHTVKVLNEYKNGDIGLDDLIAKVENDFNTI